MKKGKWNIIVRTQGINNESELKNALYSIIAQKYTNLSVILVIHSADENIINSTKDLLKFFERLIEIKIVVAKQKQGLRSYPLNVGLRYVDGEYLSFLDHDDIYYPNMGSTLIGLLNTKETTLAYGTCIKVVQEELTDKWGIKYLYTKKKFRFETKDFNLISFLLDNYIPFNTFIVKTSLIKTEEFDESLDYLEDWDFLRRLAIKKDFSLIQTKIPVSEYRVREDDTDSFNKKNYSKWLKSRQITDDNIQNKDIVLKLDSLNEFNKNYCQEMHLLEEELNKVRCNPAYKLWVFIRDMKLVNSTAVRLIRFIRRIFTHS